MPCLAARRPRRSRKARRAARAGNLRFLNPPTSFKNPGFNHAVEATGLGASSTSPASRAATSTTRSSAAPGDLLVQVEQAFLDIRWCWRGWWRLRARRQTRPLFHRPAGALPHDARYIGSTFRSGAHAGLDHDPGAASTDEKAIYEVDVVAVLPPA